MRGEGLGLVAILYALLHDVGKPIQRYALRVHRGVERPTLRANTLVERVTGYTIDAIVARKIRHDTLSDRVVEWLLGSEVSEEVKRSFGRLLSKSDSLAASERGYETGILKCIQEVAEIVEREAPKRLRAGYDASMAPLLSPLWMLLKTGYLDALGPDALARGEPKAWSGRDARGRLCSLLSRLLGELESCNARQAAEENLRLLEELAGEELWIPVLPLDPDTLVKLRAGRYADAMRESRYGLVVERMLGLLEEVKRIWPSEGGAPVVTRGFIDTLEAILRASTLLVPSAVYASILPDISLYSHSKLVAAYTAASRLSERFRILVIDLRGIQEFIAAPVKAAAASRVLRGRSLLVELVSDAVTEYALFLFGGLPRCNVITYEGGTIDLLIPDLGDVGDRLAKLEEVVERLVENELNHMLDFTLAVSEPFSSNVGFIAFMCRGGPSFADVLDGLAVTLAVEKATRASRRRQGIVDDVDEIVGFDALTLEPVRRSDTLRLEVGDSREAAEYVEYIAGGKLKPGDMVSGLTHLSLAAGSVARNLIAVIAVHVFDKRASRPDEERVRELAERISRQLLEGRLAGTVKLSQGVEYRVAIVPLSSIGALYLLLSMVALEPYDPGEARNLNKAWSIIASALQVVSDSVARIAGGDREVRLRILVVNAPHAVIPTRDAAPQSSEVIRRLVSRLTGKGVDVSFGYVMLNSYHPVDEEGRLRDLDAYDLISFAKMDGDLVGEVRSLLSISPSRLVTFSDLVNTVVQGKAYLTVLRRRLEVVPLYAGGDDVTIYGDWMHVTHYIAEVYRQARSVLKPLLFSVAIVTGKPATPILELYSMATSLLEEVAKRTGASAALNARYTRCTRTSIAPKRRADTPCSLLDSNLVKLETMPVENPNRYYPWPDEPASYWSLETLADMLNPQTLQKLREKLEEVKHDLYAIATLAARVEESREPHQILQLKIYYAYTWARRRGNLEKLLDVLKEYVKNEEALPPKPYDEKRSLGEALRIIQAAKPVLDALILALRHAQRPQEKRVE